MKAKPKGSSTETLAELKRDIVAELTNAYYETYRYDRPNDNVGQLTAFARDLAENDVNELLQAYLTAKLSELLEKAKEYEVTDLERLDYHKETPLVAVPVEAIKQMMEDLR